jgi:hypothetical protein
MRCKQPARQPQVIASGQRIDGSDLKLGLTGHDLEVGSRDRQTREHCSLHERFIYATT